MIFMNSTTFSGKFHTSSIKTYTQTHLPTIRHIEFVNEKIVSGFKIKQKRKTENELSIFKWNNIRDMIQKQE